MVLTATHFLVFIKEKNYVNRNVCSGGGGIDTNLEVGVEKKVGTITIDGATYTRYVKLFSAGTLPNTTSKDMFTFDEPYEGIIGLSGWARSNNSPKGQILPIPYATGTEAAKSYVIGILARANTGVITITTNYNYGSYTAFVVVEYYR